MVCDDLLAIKLVLSAFQIRFVVIDKKFITSSFRLPIICSNVFYIHRTVHSSTDIKLGELKCLQL